MKKSKVNYLLNIILITTMSFIFIYAGHFLIESCSLQGKNSSPGAKAVTNAKDKIYDKNPVEYKHITTTISGNKQEINILEVNPGGRRVQIKPVLSYDSVFGFEKLSSIAARSGAYAVVNAGFFYEFGQPSGLVVKDGKLLTKASGKFPVFIFEGECASIKDMEMQIFAESNGRKIEIHDINILGDHPGKIIAYTPEFGIDNRAKSSNITAIIKNNIVIKVVRAVDKVDIPKDGMLITFFEPINYNFNNLPIREGDRLELEYTPYLGPEAQAYECGSWIVRDGKIIIEKKDEWVGVTTNWDPRTAVGLKDDGTVIFLTVDGRQPQFSVGLTGRELGQFLLDYGIKNAAMLDGGASTEMIVEGKMVNRPSHNAQERPLAGAIAVWVK